MFGKQAFFYLVSLTILLPMQSPAFLPVVAAGLQIADTMMDMSKSARVAIDVSDYLDLIDAGGELSEELTGESSATSEQEELARKIRELRSTMIETGYTEEEVRGSLSSLTAREATTAQKIRALTRTAKSLKKINSKIGSFLGSPEADSATQQVLLQTQQSSLQLQMKYYQDQTLKDADEKLAREKAKLENRQSIVNFVSGRIKDRVALQPKMPIAHVLPALTVSDVKALGASIGMLSFALGAIFMCTAFCGDLGVKMMQGGFAFLFLFYGLEAFIGLFQIHFGVA
jgi:hypothetical protein